LVSTSLSFKESSNRFGLQRDPSFHFQKHVQQLVDELRANPQLDIEERIAAAVDADFPPVINHPTPEDMDAAVSMPSSDPDVKFEKGQWCEYLGDDMEWHLAQVRRVVRVAPEDYDPTSLGEPAWEYYYQFPGGAVAAGYDVRASEEALKRVFGLRPWLWQQWALVGTSNSSVRYEN
jgi:hypothetical protein